MINRIRLCCFAVNTVHSCIIANNFVQKNLKNVKVVNINQELSINKTKRIIDKYYTKNKNNVIYLEFVGEQGIHDYLSEKFVFVIYGDETFISNANKYLENVNFRGYIINCYNIFNTKIDTKQIISEHDYYINTAGIYKKEALLNINNNGKFIDNTKINKKTGDKIK